MIATNPHSPAAHETISHWVVSAIKFANPNRPVSADGQVHQTIRTDDVRAISTLWAYFSGVSIVGMLEVTLHIILVLPQRCVAVGEHLEHDSTGGSKVSSPDNYLRGRHFLKYSQEHHLRG